MSIEATLNIRHDTTLRGLPGVILALCAVCLTAMLLGAAPASAESELEVLGQGPVNVHAIQGANVAEVKVPVLNTGSTPVAVHAQFQAASSESVTAKLAAPITIDPGAATSVTLTFGGLKSLSEAVTGVIVFTGDGAPVAQSVTVVPALQPSADWPVLIVCLSMGIALFLIVIVVMEVAANGQWSRLMKPAPSPKWSFESWATHLTAVGAVLATVLASASFPEAPRQIDKESLVALGLLFGALVVVAPFVFEAIQSPKAAPSGEGGSGFVWVLIVSCGLTLGAVCGELATLGLAAWEIMDGHETARIAIEAALGLLAALAVYYVMVTATKAAMTDWQAHARRSRSIPPREVASGEAHEYVHILAPRGRWAEVDTTNVTVVPQPAPSTPSWALP